MRKLLYSVLSGLFFYGWVVHAETDLNLTSHEKTPFCDPLLKLESQIKAPAFWGIQLIGADFTKTSLRSFHLNPVSVVVSDQAISEGASRKILLSNHEKSSDFKLLLKTGIGQKFSTLLGDQPLIKEIKNFAIETLPIFNRFMFSSNLKIHGKHVAGTIGAQGFNFGVSNIAEIEELDIFHGMDGADNESMIEGYQTLIDRNEPVPVLNMSHALSADVKIVELLKTLVQKKQTICVIASHNQGEELRKENLINQLDDCIIVGSLGFDGIKSDFSNYGPVVGLIAPGEAIVSLGDQFEWHKEKLSALSGTSMAAPEVSGAAANLKGLLPLSRAEDIRKILYETAIDIGLPGRDAFTGYGVLNVLKATRVAENLVKKGLTSADEIHAALADPKIFNLDDLSRKALSQAYQAGASSPIYLNLRRKAALLSGKAEDFLELGTAYMAAGYSAFGRGMFIMAVNRKEAKIDKKNLSEIASHLASVQEKILKDERKNSYVIGSLANADLLMEVYRKLSFESARLTYKTMKAQMNVVAPERLAELEQRFPQKLYEIEELDLAATLKMGDLFDPNLRKLDWKNPYEVTPFLPFAHPLKPLK
ncbi:MAG: hypothetical protein JWQ35_2052 [Bacteriovoracaceae bacterium]|nr:hypothetical protein [Bacteriovoracaceae bacterium]